MILILVVMRFIKKNAIVSMKAKAVIVISVQVYLLLQLLPKNCFYFTKIRSHHISHKGTVPKSINCSNSCQQVLCEWSCNRVSQCWQGAKPRSFSLSNHPSLLSSLFPTFCPSPHF